MRADGDAVGNGSRLQVVEAGIGQQVERRVRRIGDQQAAPFQHPHDAPAEGVKQPSQFGVVRSARAVESDPSAVELIREVVADAAERVWLHHRDGDQHRQRHVGILGDMIFMDGFETAP
jgi:hypothetical protein